MLARFIDLEGIDQSGKKTQARLLSAKLRSEGFRVSTLDFPVYATPAGKEIRAFLNGMRNYPPRALHMLYSLNRWENSDKILQSLDSTDFLVADRYTASNLAYGLAKGLELEWLISLDKGLPKPNTVVVLDVPVESSFARKTRRRDLHETNQALLSRVRRNYLKLARRFRWRIISGTRSASKVQSELLKTLGIKS